MLIRTECSKYVADTINSLDGAQLKWKSGNRFYKKDKYGYESLAEMLVSELEEHIDNFPHVNYYSELKIVNGRYERVCWSEDCKRDWEIEYTFYEILKKYGKWYKLLTLSGIDAVSYVVDCIDWFIGFRGTREYLSRVFFLDSIVLNSDRHFNNISVLVGNDSSRFFPVMDNGLSLLSNIKEYPLNCDIRSLMSMVCCMPFSSNFGVQCSYFRDCDKLVIDYDSLMTNIEIALNNIDDYVYYGKPVFKRMCEVLNLRLKELEGRVWVRK